MGSTLNEAVKITRVLNSTAVGTTAINSSVIDMTGYDGCMFIVMFGTITDGTPAVKMQQDTVVGMGSAADLAGTSVTCATTDDNKCVVIDVKKPVKGFVRAVITRGGATGAVIDGVLAIQYGANAEPTTHDSSVANADFYASPAEGTA